MNTLLIADDVRTTLSIGKAFLEAHDFKVFAVASSTQVLSLAVAVKPALIILDYDMPEMTGEEVCRRLKSNRETSAIPVMILSGHSAANIIRACMDAGAEQFVRKAEGREGLLAHVCKILDLPQRRHPRVQCQMEVGIRRGDDHILGLIHNLSQGGVYMTVNEALEVGEAVHLQFTLPDLDHTIQVLGEVVRSESLGGSVCGYGIQLLEAKEADLNALKSYLDRPFVPT